MKTKEREGKACYIYQNGMITVQLTLIEGEDTNCALCKLAAIALLKTLITYRIDLMQR